MFSIKHHTILSSLSSLFLTISFLLPCYNYSMGQNQISMEEMERFQEEFSKMSPEEQEKLLMEEFNKLSPEEKQQVIDMQTQIFETISTLEKEVGKERLEAMSEDELLQLLDSKFGMQKTEPIVVEQTPVVAPVALVVPEKSLSELNPILNNIIQRTESFLLKASNIPELPGKIESWLIKGTINEWNSIKEYATIRHYIEKFNAYLRTLLTAKGEAWYGTYVNNNAEIKSILLELEKVLVTHEPLIEITTFDMKKIGNTSKKSLIAVINGYGHALNNKKIIDVLLTAVAQYEPEAKKLRDLKSELQKKAEASIRLGVPQRRIDVGSHSSSRRSNVGQNYDDYYGTGSDGRLSGGYDNSYGNNSKSGYVTPNKPNKSTNTMPASTNTNKSSTPKKTTDNKETEKSKKNTEKVSEPTKTDEANKRVEIMIKLCQELATFDKALPAIFLTNDWFKAKNVLSDADKEFAKTTLVKLIRHLRQNIAEEIKTLKVVLRKHDKAKEYQTKIKKAFQDSSLNIRALNTTLCHLEQEYAQYEKDLGPYAYTFLHLGTSKGKNTIKAEKTLYDLQTEYATIEDLIEDMVVISSTK